MRWTGGWRAMAVLTVVVLLVLAVAIVATRPAASPAPTPTSPVGLLPTSGAGDGGAVSGASTPAGTSSVPAATPLAGRLAGEPNPALTPGAANPAVTQANIGSTICRRGWTATVRPPASYTTALKRRQIAQYGYTDTRLADYEEDHLISLELGGAPSDPSNLWPEPYTVALPDGTPVGARVKDQLENRLNDLVCGGQMPLAEAQHLIANHWIAAWRRYVAP